MPTKTPLNDRICIYCRYHGCHIHTPKSPSKNFIMRFIDAFIGR